MQVDDRGGGGSLGGFGVVEQDRAVGVSGVVDQVAQTSDNCRFWDPGFRLLQSDVVQVVEVLPVEAAEHQQRGAHESSAMPPSGDWRVQRPLDIPDDITV